MSRNAYVVRVVWHRLPGMPYGSMVRCVYARGASEPIAVFTRAVDARAFRDAMNRRRP